MFSLGIKEQYLTEYRSRNMNIYLANCTDYNHPVQIGWSSIAQILIGIRKIFFLIHHENTPI